jgi:probable DNA repair protein
MQYQPEAPVAAKRFAVFARRALRLPAIDTPSRWAEHMAKLLRACGWPGDSLSSGTFQVQEAWNDLLADFATLDPLLPTIAREDFSRVLQDFAAARIFQYEDPGAPVQILGPLEALGTRFDASWLLGMHDGAWPIPGQPNPFLPIELQRAAGLPHATVEAEIAFSSRIFKMLLDSAGATVLSCSEKDQDRELLPSRVLQQFRPKPALHIETTHWTRALWHSRPALERIVDETGPRLDLSGTHPGGASIFKRQAECPFRAFAEFRLGARQLEPAELGLDPPTRGGIAHEALQILWSELKSSEALTRHDVVSVVSRAVHGALDRFRMRATTLWQQRLLGIEHQRMTGLLLDLLDLERQRAAPFDVLELEQTRDVSVGGLQITVRADRIDEVGIDGVTRQVILDYKATAPSPQAWESSRPDEPQIPLYAIQMEQPLAGASFVQLKTGELTFKGYADAGVLPHSNPPKYAGDRVTFDQLKAEWRRTLENLAADFVAGRASVDPKQRPQTCSRCPLPSFCRIAEAALPESDGTSHEGGTDE